MAQRRDLELALLAALIAVSPGCAGKPVMPWSKAKSPATLEELTAKNNAQQSGSWTDKFTIKPKVIPATDPTHLDAKSPKVGAEVFVRAARIHESRGSFAEAKQQYQKAIEAEPKSVTAIVGLARLHDRQEEFAAAEKLYRQAAGIDPKSGLVWNDLGLCYARQQRHDDAVKSLSQAIKIAPQNSMYRNNLATVLVQTGKVDEAWSHLTAVNEPAVAHYNMGFLLHKQQQNELAAQHLQLALQADPELSAAEQLLTKLQGRPAAPAEEFVAERTDDAQSYTISDERAPAQSQPEQPTEVASGPSEIVNPLVPSGRRSPTYRMPPTQEHADDPSPSPTRLPAPPDDPREAAEAEQGPELSFPARRIAHTEDAAIRQPNVIKLLGSEPLAAPIPVDEE